MKSQIFPALKLTFACIVVFAVLYPLSVWAIAQFAPNGGKGETISRKGQPVGYVHPAIVADGHPLRFG